MPDVALQPSAPASAPSPAPQSAPAGEVVINQNPVNTPSPLGPQAPQAPAEVKGSTHRPESRREAIQRAFDRANNPPPKQAKPAEREQPKAADAKPGHNKPPVETEHEGLDLKKRPSDQPRSERGTFAPRQPAQVAQQANQQPGAAPQQQPGQRPAARQLPEGTPYREPPPRFSERAKADWAAAPETVRGDVHRMHAEFGNAYQRMKADIDAFQPVRRFHEMAQQHGTTLEKALNNYVSMEQKLRADPIGGLDVIINNLGLKTPDGQRIGLRDIAYHVLTQSPEQIQVMKQGNAQQAAAQQIGALHQEVRGLKEHLAQMHTAQKFNYTRSQVDQFADAHPRFDELGDLIEKELQFGFDLESAYRRAELLRPATHAAQTRTTPAQTRPIDRSISGAPDVTGSNPASRRNEKPVGRREAIQNAIRRVNGS